ncbi:hypothetical protein HJC23_013805 [Cyclotella cryptica]|uniref:F5/8 type C domain-containing protein n=1 Tax=Cyclotella cryptica TaxID=29204 RepID=A0ABD3NQ81_9STRA
MRKYLRRSLPLLLSGWTVASSSGKSHPRSLEETTASTSSFYPPDPCLSNDTFQLVLDGRCTYDALRNAIADKLSRLSSPCDFSDPNFELVSLFSPEWNETDARSAVEELCTNAIMEKLGPRGSFDFDLFSGMDHEFNKAFFDGQSAWNDGGAKWNGKSVAEPQALVSNGEASPEFHGRSKTILSVKNRHATTRQMTWPDNYENFAQCDLNAAMCCWVDHDPAQEVHFQKNTDICYVDNTRAPSSNHIDAGVALYGGINGLETAFCHGFAWEEGSLDDVFKGNLLFLSEIYENMHNHGLSNNVPGAPMCGCIEKMPVVTRADCSMLEYNGKFLFKHSPYNNSITARGKVTIDTVECNGLYGEPNDLRSYYTNLFLQGKVDEIQKSYFDEIIVGDYFCPFAIASFLNDLFSNTTESSMHPTLSPTPTTLMPTWNSTTSPSLTSCSPKAKKVKVESTTGEQLQMFEFQVFSSGINIAPGKTAIQSSSYSGFYASLAIDGNLNTFSHTNDDNSWWILDLEGMVSIDSISIANRFCGSPSDSNGCLCRLSYASVQLLNHQDAVVAEGYIGDTCGELQLSWDLSSSEFCGTEMPSISPTEKPVTESPTKAPTSAPSGSPTNDPTLSPSWNPTKSPSAPPTFHPSLSPVSDPTSSPNASPTLSPILNPTASPSDSPSYSPTLSPVSNPTLSPIVSPTLSPASNPSSSPSASPTYSPTLSPVLNPTTSPSDSPTLSPLSNPTSSPSASPTYSPTLSPILNPTTSPSASPTLSPESNPTSSPSASPTYSPTLSPVSALTYAPTIQCSPKATKVKLSSTTGEQLQMFEFQVFSSGVNIALGRNAIQSSNYSGFHANRAIDNDLTTFSHTNDTSSWWEVDLEEMVYIDSITIANRFCGSPSDPNGCLCRLSYASVQLLNHQDAVVADGYIGDTCGELQLRWGLSSNEFCGTEMPSISPTEKPVTESPTKAPTSAPSGSPTNDPTLSPSWNPTKSPSAPPTFHPSLSPVSDPTSSPNASPTLSPILNPTASPSDSPSYSPTLSPVSNPTLSPIVSPTLSPASNPSSSPSASPTYSPTLSPVLNPTTSPSDSPTLSPLSNPTSSPSASPTYSPTLSPILNPTTSPSDSPTLSPVSNPTSSPSASPTYSRTLSPVSALTYSPTIRCFPNATKVKLSSTTGEQLQMFEFQVFSSGVNIALGKNASQSSNYNGFLATRAIDNDLTTFSHTNDNNSWWEVDLEGLSSLETVSIANRWCSNPSDPNGCLCRLTSASVELLDDLDTVIVQHFLGDTCSKLQVNIDLSSIKFCADSP